MHFQTFSPASLRAHTDLQALGQELGKQEAPTDLKTPTPPSFSFLNLFLSASAILTARFLGEKMGLTPVWSAGKLRSSIT